MWMNMKRSLKTVLGILLTVLMMTGCGEAGVPDTIDKPMISIAKTGEITEYLVGEFGAKDYYSISELSSMAAEEAARYNTASQTGTTVPVRMEKAEALEDGSGRVYIIYQYDCADSYTDFNEGSLFYGTVGEAAAKGFSVDIALKGVTGSGDDTLTAEQVRQAADRQLIIAPGGLYVYCPGKVQYISDNAVMEEDGSVNGTASADPVYILLK